MWKNYFIVALRNISKNKINSLIKVSGLAIGLASAILITLFIFKEISFDRFHVHADRIHRLYIDGNIGEQNFTGAWTSMVMAPTFAQEIEAVEQFVRFDVFNQQLIWNKGEKHIEDHFLFADSSVFETFSFTFLTGNPETALTLPRSLVITREKALMYFGDEDPLGQSLTVNRDSNLYMVTGVVEAMPANSHFFADFIASMSTLEYSREETWFQNSIFSYILLKEGADWKEVERRMQEVMLEKIRPELENVLGLAPEEWSAGGNRYGIYLQPLKDIHLNPDIEVGLEICFRPATDRRNIFIFALVASFILLIASINFMNLSTARSALRIREIAMRKVAGSDRSLLVRQFLLESVLMSLIALAFALILVELSLDWFNQAMNLDLRMDSGRNLGFLGVIVALTVLVGLLSGIYPAVFMSRFQPVEGFKGAFQGARGALVGRNILVVVQFTMSIAIIAGSLVVATQLRHLLNKDLGFDREQVLVLKRIYPLENSIQAFCREVEKIPGVVAASNSTTYLGFNNSTETYQIEGRDPAMSFLFGTNYVDAHFRHTYDFKLVGRESRFFKEVHPADSMSILVNQVAVEEYGMEDPFNTYILEPTFAGDTNRLRIIGVMDNFHHSSLHEPVGPYMIRYKPEVFDWAGYISIRLGVAGKGLPSTLKKIRGLWLGMTGDAPFQYFFLDRELEQYYKEERRSGRLSVMFAVLATFIACMGLFGLTLHKAQRKTREIGVRKAMGASTKQVVLYVSREMITLVTISIGLAWILAFLFANKWLAGFPYNIGFTPWVYLLAALMALLVATVTVATLAFRMARSNPAEVLHHE